MQGAELEVIKGMGDLLAKVKWVFLEVSKKSYIRAECSKVRLILISETEDLEEDLLNGIETLDGAMHFT